MGRGRGIEKRIRETFSVHRAASPPYKNHNIERVVPTVFINKPIRFGKCYLYCLRTVL